MKFFIVFLLFVSSACFCQQKKDSLPQKQDSTVIVMSQFLAFLQDKITVKEYLPIMDAVNAFIKSKEFVNPKK